MKKNASDASAAKANASSFLSKADIMAGFSVFLIALPLCLGISLASGFPSIAGVFTAIVGGLFVSFFKGSQLTIKGPAAGLIVIALGAVEELGQGDNFRGYTLTLAVIVAAGIVQILMGLLKWGDLVDFFPASAVHGMLAAIGIIIIAKQLPVMMGATTQAKDPIGMLLHIPEMLENLNPHIAIIGFSSLALLIFWSGRKGKFFKAIPAPLAVLLLAFPLEILYRLDVDHEYIINGHIYHTGPDFLVNLPSNLLSAIQLPDFSQLISSTSIKYIIMFALVGSLESLLSSKAIDLLDPQKRNSNMNRDLIGVGVGNSLVGMVGGLPMISEIVRSSANINAGAKSYASNFYHGLFLLIFVVFFPDLIHRIPLAALAAMLVFTGFRLASPKAFKHSWEIGKEQLLIFCTTIIVTLLTDLLLGILAGICIKLLQSLYHGISLKDLFKAKYDLHKTGQKVRIELKSGLVFTNYLGFQKLLRAQSEVEEIEVNLSRVNFVDHTSLHNLDRLKDVFSQKGILLSVHGLDQLNPRSAHPFAAHKRKK